MNEKIVKAKITSNFLQQWLICFSNIESRSIDKVKKSYLNDDLKKLDERISGKIVKLRQQNFGTDLEPDIDYFEYEDNNFVIPEELFEIIE